jgi:hypothetical protein
MNNTFRSIPFVLAALMFSICSYALDCQRRTYNQPGYACTINEKYNATIMVKIWVRKTCSVTSTDKIFVNTPGGEVAFTLPDSQTVYFESPFVLPRDNHDFSYRAEIQPVGGHSASHFDVTIEAYSTRPNAFAPQGVLHPNGDFEYGFKFLAGTPVMRSLQDVYTEAWYARADGTLTRRIGELNMRSACNDRPTPCVGADKIPAAVRGKMSLDEDRIVVIVDRLNALPEYIEDDNYWAMGDSEGFRMENVPAFMQTLPSSKYGGGWARPANMLGTVWGNADPKGAGEAVSGIDWSMPLNTDIMRMSWIRDRANALDGRGEESYAQLVNPSYFTRPKAKEALAANLRLRFAALGKRNILLSDIDAQGLLYHQQYIQRISVQAGYYGYTSSGYGANLTPDALSGAMGAHNLFLVPYGIAQRNGANIDVTISSVYVHSADLFDFRRGGSLVEQPLGCWSTGKITALPHDGSVCVNNFAYRYYRQFKQRGGDFVVMTNRLQVPTQTIRFTIPYNLGL